MARTGKHIALTYNGIDGACAAAAVVLGAPDAEVRATSAVRVGQSLAALTTERPQSVHVCGVGLWCDWDEARDAAQALLNQGARIYWYCGRGYLDSDRARFAEFCEPVFLDEGSNTAAVVASFGLADLPRARDLCRLALHDPNLARKNKAEGVSREDRRWLELIEASLAQYFKYQDSRPYQQAVVQLARGELRREDLRAIERYREIGRHFVLHGRSEGIKDLRRLIRRCGDVDRSVLITGESGVGKEHVAHLVRERGRRAMGPFVAVNCAMYAGNAGLANSDLFGHIKGAFTGAVSDRRGRFVEADQGVLYLDELGELPPEVQAKLLRVVEDGYVTPEGADRPACRVDVRIISATNRDLPAMIRRSDFRADLYHRVATLRIHVPPLRERIEDIRAIARERLRLLGEEGYERNFSRADWARIERHSWPGNARQLIKVIERAVLLDLPLTDVLDEEEGMGALYDGGSEEAGSGLLPGTTGEVRPLREIQEQYARRAWELYEGNYAATARALGIQPNTLRYTYIDKD